MTKLISQEAAIAIATNRESHAKGETARACRGIAISLSMLPAAPAVKVKPLVWAEAVSGEYKRGECYYTRSIVSVAPISASKTRYGWWLNIDCKTYPSLEAAKSAAQADYEARILAALEGGEA